VSFIFISAMSFVLVFGSVMHSLGTFFHALSITASEITSNRGVISITAPTYTTSQN
jgi:hypothetical protein